MIGRAVVIRQRGWFGVRVGKVYVSLRSPAHRALFSERNRVRCRVLPLRGGWRIVARRDGTLA